MRTEYKDLMEKLGVSYELSPYETYPWYHYDETKGITCSAEVRAGPNLTDIEAELQFLYDEGVTPEEEEEDEEGKEDSDKGKEEDPNAWRDSWEEIEKRRNFAAPKKTKGFINDGPQQIFFMRILPSNDGLWSPTIMILKGEDFVNKIYDWEGKGCNFFRACIEALQMGELPNIKELIETELDDDRWGGRGKRGKIGKKSPKVNPAALLGMKR